MYILTHTVEKVHTCNIQETISSGWAFQNTHNGTTGEKPHKGNKCEKQFTQSGHLKTQNDTYRREATV